MPSDESNSSSAPAPEPPAKKPVNPVGLVVLSLLLMAGLVWIMAPTRARNFQPAPLRPPPAGCPKTAADFVPSDVTDIPNDGFRVAFAGPAESCALSLEHGTLPVRVQHQHRRLPVESPVVPCLQ